MIELTLMSLLRLLVSRYCFCLVSFWNTIRDLTLSALGGGDKTLGSYFTNSMASLYQEHANLVGEKKGLASVWLLLIRVVLMITTSIAVLICLAWLLTLLILVTIPVGFVAFIVATVHTMLIGIPAILMYVGNVWRLASAARLLAIEVKDATSPEEVEDTQSDDVENGATLT